jgi:phage shock protein PspC (stress-responsive transcriptional regulator)
MNDTPKKNNKNKKTEKTGVGPQRPLLRSKSDRMIWGVAGGLSEHLNVDSTLVRIAFVLTCFIGGLGLLAYLVLAVALPEDDGTGKPVEERVSARLGRVLVIVILVAAALCLACGLAAASAWTAATGHGVIVASVVIGLGVLLAVVAFVGDFRRRVAPWLLAAALVLAIPAGAVAAADIHIDESIGKRDYSPATATDVPAGGYELGAGQLIVDLRDLQWTPGQTIAVEADLGFGQMIVSVPASVCVDAHATAKGGELLVAGEQSHGIDSEVDKTEPIGKAPRLELDAELQFGQMIVTDQAPEEVDRHGRGFDDDHNQEEADSQQQVCGR